MANLKDYINMIKQQLLKGIEEEIRYNLQLSQGKKSKSKQHRFDIEDHHFEPIHDNHKNFIEDHHYKTNKSRGMSKQHKFEDEYEPVDDIHDHHYKTNKNRTKGGKLNIKKEFNKGLHSVEHGLLQGISEGVKKGTSEITHQGIGQLKNYLTSPAMEETGAEMAMAAGIRRRKRTISVKEKKRHDMIRRLMHQKGMTLAQASTYIKRHELI